MDRKETLMVQIVPGWISQHARSPHEPFRQVASLGKKHSEAPWVDTR